MIGGITKKVKCAINGDYIIAYTIPKRDNASGGSPLCMLC